VTRELEHLKQQAEAYFAAAKESGSPYDYYKGSQLMEARRSIALAVENSGVRFQGNVDDLIDNVMQELDAAKAPFLKDNSFKKKALELEKLYGP